MANKMGILNIPPDKRGNKKGYIPKSYATGELQKKDLRSRTPEERKRIAQMGVEARRRNSAKRKTLKECLKIILENDVISDEHKALLKKYGFDDDNTTNQAMIMLALFKKGLTGDVIAIREIIETMDKLDMLNKGKQLTGGNVTINLITKGEDYQITEDDKKDIWDAENNDTEFVESEILENKWDAEEDWGSDVYE